MCLEVGSKYVFMNNRGTSCKFFEVLGSTPDSFKVQYYDRDWVCTRESTISKRGDFARRAKEIYSVKRELKNFFIVWVEGGPNPVRRKYENIAEAQKACNYLIDQKGVKEVYILKKVGKAFIPSRCKFEMD
jgi:hypothetical protein